MPWSIAMMNRLVLAASIGATALAGCRLAVDPFTDELAGRSPVTTPSVEAARNKAGLVRAAQVEHAVSQRSHMAAHLNATDGRVTHGPLYFEDPFENPGDEDGNFAWSGKDYMHWLYGPGRFLVNVVVFPVKAAVSPPWIEMGGDGGA